MNPQPFLLETTAQAGRQLVLTKHACRRARERFHWTSQALFRMADRALCHGIAPGNAGGLLKFFLFSRVSAEEAACPFLYGENVYVFAMEASGTAVVLKTVYRAPQALLRTLVNRPIHHSAAGTHGYN
jgi:hypothetical protein